MVSPFYFLIKKNKLLFFSIFLGLAFSLGLWMLTNGPTRFISNLAQNNNWSIQNINFIEKVIILIFFSFVVAMSYYLTLWLSRKNKTYYYISISFFSLLLISSLGIFSFYPEFLIDKKNKITEVEVEKAEFYFGSYPDLEKLNELKRQKYTAVISLLNNTVVPAEPLLIEKEKKNAEKIGIQVISIPMLPWIVENDDAIVQIERFARNAKGKYYVHCYLGKDRANVFKNILEAENKKISIKGELSARLLDTLQTFERGEIIKLKNSLYITPFPTDEEFFGFIINGKIKNVVSIINPKNKIEIKDLLRERKILNQYKMNFIHLPYINYQQCKLISDSIKKLERPIVIHSYKSNSIEINQLLNFLNNETVK